MDNYIVLPSQFQGFSTVLVNLTRYTLRLIKESGEVLCTIPGVNDEVRILERVSPASSIHGVPIKVSYLADSKGNIEYTMFDIPHYESHYYIVPPLVGQLARRGDFLVPDILLINKHWEEGSTLDCHGFVTFLK